jgi:broad specificity phosphatase PhoE
LDLEGENLLPRFQEKLADVRRGLEYLKQQNTKLDLVVSHGLTIAVVIWAMSNPDKYNDPEYKLTMDDLSTILNQAKIISCTSLTELDVFGDKTVVKDVALNPHLNKK